MYGPGFAQPSGPSSYQTPHPPQGIPSGAISGQAVDPDNLPLPGVTVIAASPALQGPRTAVTSPNGDFFIPFLPPGEYSITLVLPGFEPQ